MPRSAESPFDYCVEQVRRLDHDRYLCSLFAPPPARRALIALYAFNLEIASTRELVSEPMLGEIRLQWWRETIAGLCAGTPRDHPVALALAQGFADVVPLKDRLQSLVAARAFDLGGEAPADQAALLAYADATSGALLRLALVALGVDNAAAERAAGEIGIAWAVIGLIRAIPFHARARRLYLPRDLMADAGLSAETVFEGQGGPALQRVVASLSDLAGGHLVAARSLRAECPKAALPALLLARLADIYGRRLRRARYDPYHPGLVVNPLIRQLRLALFARMGRF